MQNIRLCHTEPCLHLDLFTLLVRSGEQQVAVAVEAENIQAKWPEPAAQAAHLLGQAVPETASQGFVSLCTEQTRKRDRLSSTLQQGHEQVVLARRAGNDGAIDKQEVLCIAVLYVMSLQLRPFYLLERGHLCHSAASPCCEPLSGHLSTLSTAQARLSRARRVTVCSLSAKACRRSLFWVRR